MDQIAKHGTVVAERRFHLRDIDSPSDNSYLSSLISTGRCKVLDITTAFLHGERDEVITWDCQNMLKRRKKGCTMKKALYGLEQAGRCWNDKMDGWLRQQGWNASPEDARLCTKISKTGSVEMFLYIRVYDSPSSPLQTQQPSKLSSITANSSSLFGVNLQCHT